MAPTIVLVTGASRGLGRGLAQRFLAKPDHVVIAANRAPSGAATATLQDLPQGEGSRLITVKLGSAVQADGIEAVKTLQQQHGIDSLDIVVANAGISEVYPVVAAMDASDLQRHITTNVLGVVWLYQAVLPLLHKSPNPRWVTMGSSAGSLEQPPIPNGVYGPTKAMAHWYTKRINAEEPAVTAFVADPGFPNTDMGSRAAGLLGLPRAPDEPDESCDGIVRAIEEATKESHGGNFIHYRGEVLPW
ncbi:NAD(P)-binding protein [Apiospora rasikravindrae]|uniref:NAD(P)-binding protein n=1 Tax=Apiospora rasikravindrae TaxID=990691 RepID=A0ABR1TA31_9PEZI